MRHPILGSRGVPDHQGPRTLVFQAAPQLLPARLPERQELRSAERKGIGKGPRAEKTTTNSTRGPATSVVFDAALGLPKTPKNTNID